MRRYASPHWLVPYGTVLPPLDSCWGPKPSRAVSCRPVEKFFGICHGGRLCAGGNRTAPRHGRQFVTELAAAVTLDDRGCEFRARSLQVLQLLAQSRQQRADRARQLVARICQNLRHPPGDCRGWIARRSAALSGRRVRGRGVQSPPGWPAARPPVQAHAAGAAHRDRIEKQLELGRSLEVRVPARFDVLARKCGESWEASPDSPAASCCGSHRRTFPPDGQTRRGPAAAQSVRAGAVRRGAVGPAA